MGERIADPDFEPGKHGFIGLIDALDAFDKPLILAVNGLGLGIGLTVIGFADLVLMSGDARLKTPFTSLGVAPEAASSYLLPRLVGRQNAAWILLSAEWISAAEAKEMGLVWRVCEPAALLDEAHRVAATLASRPISSLREVKRDMTAPLRGRSGGPGSGRTTVSPGSWAAPPTPRPGGFRRGPRPRLHLPPAGLVGPAQDLPVAGPV